MDKNIKKKINNNIEKAFNYSLDFMFATIKLIFYTILILGSTSALLLYLKMFPVEATKLYENFIPIFKILFKILQVIIGIAVGILIAWLSFNALEQIISKSKIRREQKREEFLNDLADKLKKKLKKK